MNKSVYIETYGCQMNEYDTELIQTILIDAGFLLTDSETNADVIFLNTCSVRENANNKVYNRIHTLRKAGKKNIKIGVLGCMATNFQEDLLNNKKLGIDLIAGPDSYKALPDLLTEAFNSSEKTFDITLSEFETYSDVMPTRKTSVNAWIAIMRGCNNFCSYCIVPYTRGRERSRAPESIIKEVSSLVKKGLSQVTLLGQNVNSYHYENYNFLDLLKMVSDIEGLQRIRFTSPHPKDFPVELLHLMAERSNICNQIHLPLQAGNSRILKKMNRTYSKEKFLELALECQSILPNVTLSTDIIVGFPSETEAEFVDTVDVIKKVEFDSAFIFKYSERSLTAAAKNFPDDVTEDEKTKRIVLLNEIQKDISYKKNQQEIGQIQEILIESEATKKDNRNFQGRNEGNKLVIIPEGNYKTGDYIQVKITDATPHVLRGIALES